MSECKNCIHLGDIYECGECNGPQAVDTRYQGVQVHPLGVGIAKFSEALQQVGTTFPVEHDPNGIPVNAAGAKLDAGKNRLGLVLGGFARALQEVGKVGTFGANKYTDNGWVEVPDGKRRYTDAMLRHILKEAAGEEVDVDSGLLHAAHAAWNALARLDLMLRQGE